MLNSNSPLSDLFFLHSGDDRQTLPHQVLQTGMERRERACLFLWLERFCFLCFFDVLVSGFGGKAV